MSDCHDICELPGFTNDAEKIFSEEELIALIDSIAARPEQGRLIPQTGGVRYMRAIARGHGKGRGARVVYFCSGPDMPIYLLARCFKGRKETITAADRRNLGALASDLKAAYRERANRRGNYARQPRGGRHARFEGGDRG